MSMEQLHRRVAELEGMLTSNKASTFGNGGSRVTPREPGGRDFLGTFYGCGERGHRQSECAKRVSLHLSANQADASTTIDEVNNPIAFPAIVRVRSWADVVRQDEQPQHHVVDKISEKAAAFFLAKTSTTGDRRPLPASQGTYARWCTDSGASDHVTS